MLVFQEKTIPNMPGRLFLFKTTLICASVKSDLLDEKKQKLLLATADNYELCELHHSQQMSTQ